MLIDFASFINEATNISYLASLHNILDFFPDINSIPENYIKMYFPDKRNLLHRDLSEPIELVDVYFSMKCKNTFNHRFTENEITEYQKVIDKFTEPLLQEKIVILLLNQSLKDGLRSSNVGNYIASPRDILMARVEYLFKSGDTYYRTCVKFIGNIMSVYKDTDSTDWQVKLPNSEPASVAAPEVKLDIQTGTVSALKDGYIKNIVNLTMGHVSEEAKISPELAKSRLAFVMKGDDIFLSSVQDKHIIIDEFNIQKLSAYFKLDVIKALMDYTKNTKPPYVIPKHILKVVYLENGKHKEVLLKNELRILGFKSYFKDDLALCKSILFLLSSIHGLTKVDNIYSLELQLKYTTDPDYRVNKIDRVLSNKIALFWGSNANWIIESDFTSKGHITWLI